MKRFVGNILLSFICCLAFPQFTTAQINIIGKVIDKETGELVPHCNIGLVSSAKGTASNELGEFVIEVDSLPVTLIFSHIGYKKMALQTSALPDKVIELEPLTTNLEEVTVLGSKNDPYALELAKKAFEKAEKHLGELKHAKAFYRQKSNNGDAYSEFSEIFYDVRYTSGGIKDWGILEGRYALREGAVNNKNYTLLSRLFAPLQPETDDLYFPLSADLEEHHELRVVSTLNSDAGKIVVIWFKPLNRFPGNTLEGEVYINADTYDILKITGNIANDKLNFVNIAEQNGYWKNYEIGYEIIYKIDGTGSSELDYIKVDQSFDYFKGDELQFPVSSTSNLVFFEHSTATSKKRLGGRLKKNKSDWQVLDEIGYNEKFWQDNPIVKRTPVEEEVIASFEKDNAFGSIFLNSRGQIAATQTNLAGDSLLTELNASVNHYNDYNPVEKIYLHTDKDMSAAGETLWYSAYTVLGAFHHFSQGSKVLHVDLIGPENEIIVSRTDEIIDGKSSGSIVVPEDLPSGNYRLRGYTQWMCNFDSDFFFTETIKIWNEKLKPKPLHDSQVEINLQFFPEGGHAVAGLDGIIAFKAVGKDGLDTHIKGRMVDGQGKHVTNLITIDRGSGLFHLNPKKDGRYSAVLENGVEYPFPKMLDIGYTMTVDNASENSIRVKIQASELLMQQPFYIVGHINNKKYYHGKFEFGGSPLVDFDISKGGIPSGVMTLTLFDQNKKPWCERAVFVNNQEEMVITAKLGSEKLQKRDKVSLDIHVADNFGEAIATELSVAITDAGQIKKSNSSGNILTHLLLQSDLKGNIDAPGLLFKDGERATVQRLDLVMLTHGWRKFPWQDMPADATYTQKFNFAKGLPISGVASGKNGNLLKNVKLNVMAQSEQDLAMFSVRTSNAGAFLISDFYFKGSADLKFNAFDMDNRPVDVQVMLDSSATTLPPSEFRAAELRDTEASETYLKTASIRKKMDDLYTFDEVTELEEVTVTEKKIEKSRNASPSVFGRNFKPSAVLYAADYESSLSVLDLVRRFSGVRVNGNKVSMRSGGSPLWVLDGVPIFDENTNSAAPPATSVFFSRAMTPLPVPQLIENMTTFTIERIEVLTQTSAAIYGSRGGNGAILIYSKTGNEPKNIKPVSSPDFTIMGHSVEREFYTPKYDVKEERHEAADYRATLYWNPSFTTGADGNATIEFFNSDSAEQIQVEIEGLSSQGIPGAYLQTFGKGSDAD